MARTVGRVLWSIREAALSVRRHPGAILFSVLTIAVSMSVLGYFGIILQNTWHLLRTLQSKMELVVFLDDGLGQSELEEIISRIEGHVYVRETRYFSKEEARKELSRDEEYRGYLESLEDNPLPASIQVKPIDELAGRGRIEELIRFMSGLAGVEEVADPEDLGRQFRATNFLLWFSLITGLLIFLATLVVVSSVIGHSLAGRGRQVETMRLLGAGRGYIKGPFMAEGLMLGIVGSFIAQLQVSVSWGMVADYLKKSFNLDVVPFGVHMMILISGLGMAVGLLGAWASIKRLRIEK